MTGRTSVVTIYRCIPISEVDISPACIEMVAVMT